jgi:hypothetical protein
LEFPVPLIYGNCETWRLGKGYPSFQPSYSHEELVEHFLLTPGELELVLKWRGNVNRCGIALLLKTLPHLGYLPGRLDEVPPEVRECVAGQIGLLGWRQQPFCGDRAGCHLKR